MADLSPNSDKPEELFKVSEGGNDVDEHKPIIKNEILDGVAVDWIHMVPPSLSGTLDHHHPKGYA